MDEQPPRFPDQPGDEPFPTFDPQPQPEPLPVQQARGTQPYRGGGQVNPWLVGFAVAVVLVAISVIFFGLLSSDGETPGTAAPTLPGTSAPNGAVSTSPTDSVPSTVTGDTTAPGTDPNTITLPPVSEAPTIQPFGDAIPLGEMTLSSNDIGPLDFGNDGEEVLGRLVSTFGDPTEDTGWIVGDGSFGECQGDAIRRVRWGPLWVIIRGEPGDSTFVSYRLDVRYGGLTSEASTLQTLSGMRVGATVGELNSIYSGFTIDYDVDTQAGLTFQLKGSDGTLLLWGPVEGQADSDLVTGIYSPNACTA